MARRAPHVVNMVNVVMTRALLRFELGAGSAEGDLVAFVVWLGLKMVQQWLARVPCIPDTVQDMLVILARHKSKGRCDDRARLGYSCRYGRGGNGPARNLHLPVVFVKFLSLIRSILTKPSCHPTSKLFCHI